MRKRVLTYSLALAMAVAMAVPQTAILPTGIVQVKAADTENGLKTGVALTKADKLRKSEKETIKEQKIILNLPKWINMHLLLQIIAARSIKL